MSSDDSSNVPAPSDRREAVREKAQRVRQRHARVGRLRLAALSISGVAVVGAVVGEFVGANSGIGYVLQVANGNFDLPLMFAALILLSLVGVVLFVLVDVVERLMIPWHASHRDDYYVST